MDITLSHNFKWKNETFLVCNVMLRVFKVPLDHSNSPVQCINSIEDLQMSSIVPVLIMLSILPIDRILTLLENPIIKMLLMHWKMHWKGPQPTYKSFLTHQCKQGQSKSYLKELCQECCAKLKHLESTWFYFTTL